jgi:hypothetical protein
MGANLGDNMTFNELDPAMLAQAQMLGQRRTPTMSEQRKIEQAQFMMAALQVSGTALSSFLEGGYGSFEDENIAFSIDVAKAILKLSEETKGDFEDNVMLRKLRNQLGAQLVYSAIRGGSCADTYSRDDATALVKTCFVAAKTLLNSADAFSKEVANEGADNTSSIILTP